MPLTVIPLVINFAISGAIWMSERPTVLQIIITIFLVAKLCVYFYSALMADSDLVHNIGLIVCGSLNFIGIVYRAIQGIWTATSRLPHSLCYLSVWRVLPTIDFSRKGVEEE